MRISLKRDEGAKSIDGEVTLEGGVQLSVYRRWEDPQWYLYSVSFSHGGYDEGVVNDSNERYKIPRESKLGEALAQAVRQETTSWTPAL